MLRRETDQRVPARSRQPCANDNRPFDEAEELLYLLQGGQGQGVDRIPGYAMPIAPDGITKIDVVLSACIVAIVVASSAMAYFYV